MVASFLYYYYHQIPFGMINGGGKCMHLKEKYTLYRMAQQIVNEGNYNVIYMNDQEQEIWLEKYSNKTSTIVRLVHRGFDWKNHLKRDIAIVFQRIKAMKRLLTAKQTVVHNVYVASHPPVDEWEQLKRPLQLNEKKPINMHVYYLVEQHIGDEQSRLAQALNIPEFTQEVEQAESEMVTQISMYETELRDNLQEKLKERNTIFSFGKPRITYVILAINIILFILLEMNGGSNSTETLIDFGAKYNPYIMDGQWWRIISSMFLHIGFLHLFMNMIAVYYLGTTIEKIFGSIRFGIIYMLSGIGGGLASFAFTSHVSAGASGALFGLFGALLFFGLSYKRLFFQTMGSNLLIVIGLNIVFGFMVPQIDMSAHMGGLVTGFIVAAMVQLPKRRKRSLPAVSFLIYIAILAGLIAFGFHQNSAAYQLMKVDSFIQQENFQDAVTSATKGLENPGEVEAALLFQRSYAYIHMDEPELAIADLEKCIDLDADLPEAYYNLAILYYDKGKLDKAEDAITKACQRRDNDQACQALYQKITGKSFEK